MKARLAGLALSMVSAWACWCDPAWAMPGEWAVGGELGAGRATRSTWSPSLGLRGAYGLAEALDLQLDVSGQWVRSSHGGESTSDALLRLVPALAYKLDVVRWIPFARIGAGPALGVPLTGDAAPSLSLALQGALGADYLFNRSVSCGLAYQADWVVGSADIASRLAPMHRLLLTVMWRSGW